MKWILVAIFIIATFGTDKVFLKFSILSLDNYFSCKVFLKKHKLVLSENLVRTIIFFGNELISFVFNFTKKLKRIKLKEKQYCGMNL